MSRHIQTAVPHAIAAHIMLGKVKTALTGT
jgi:hypothetical protein